MNRRTFFGAIAAAAAAVRLRGSRRRAPATGGIVRPRAPVFGGPDAHETVVPLERCRWRFGGPECGYTGRFTGCDKTLSSCLERCNAAQFGGFPGMPRR